MSTSSAIQNAILRPSRVLLDGTVVSGMEIEIRGDRIGEIRTATAPADWHVLLVPGFVNAHSHAFQRDLRGQGDRYPDGAGSFFTWRASMYALVDALDPERCRSISRRAFEEMLDAGITCVGEFHYVHHAADERHALDEAVVRAARDAGIRLVLLHADYVRGDFDGRDLEGGQRRFDTGSIDDYLASLDRIDALVTGPSETVVPIVHSTRAVPIDRIRRVAEEARRRGKVFHIHLEEVVAEIEACRAVHGCTPMRLLLEHGVVDRRTTAVHCTHSTAEDLADFARVGGGVCLCPNTEGNLGDGIPDLDAIRAAGAAVSIGTDLNSRIGPMEDLRWIEYVQRIRHRRRGSMVDSEGDVASPLLAAATRNGAASLGIDAGSIETGRLADLAAFDLAHRTLDAVDDRNLPAALVFGTGPEAMCGTCVGGRWLRGGPPPRAESGR